MPPAHSHSSIHTNFACGIYFLKVENKFDHPRLEKGFFFTEQKDLVKESAKKERQNEMKQKIEDIRRQHKETLQKMLGGDSDSD